jgi:two-component system, LytTR family, response regulator
MPINAIIIDDEPAARSFLYNILKENCPIINIIDIAADVKSAVKLINNHSIDLVFLDIEMPQENGFALFEYFQNPKFETIFCTAYSQYALKAFEVSAVDYIIKPISISKVVEAVEKAIKIAGQNQILERINALKSNLNVQNLQKIALPLAEGLVFVQLNDILYFEADGSYTQVVTTKGKTLVSKKIKNFDELLNNDVRFYRIHRSYLINSQRISKYHKRDGNFLEFENGDITNIAREKVKEFDEYIALVKV